AQRIYDAKEHGDLTENAEYEDAKNEQAFVEGRIQTLEALIKNATLIDEHHTNDHVQIGSTVRVGGPDGSQSFTIVGSTEAKPAEGKISNESPVGRALLGKKKGENVTVQIPAGDIAYKIASITYGLTDHGVGRRAGGPGLRSAGRQRFEDPVRDCPRRQPPRPGHPRRHPPRPARVRARDDAPVRGR